MPPVKSESAQMLFSAIRSGDLEKIRQMVADGLDINSVRDEDKSSSLHIAAMSARREICSFLLDRGADVKAKDSDGATPLHDSFHGRDLEIAEMLLSKGADINAKSREMAGTLLTMAAGAGDPTWINFAVNRKANLNLAGSSGVTPVAMACLEDKVEALGALLAAGATADKSGSDRKTPLMHAARRGNLETMELLVKNGANVNAQSDTGLTPLALAVLSGKAEPVKFLLDHGANKDVKDQYGKTPLDYAERDRLPKTIKLLK